MELLLEGLEGEEVGANVLADGSMGAATSFDGADARGGESFVAGEELCVFPVWSMLYEHFFFFLILTSRARRTW